jgi:hypothetical protein
VIAEPIAIPKIQNGAAQRNNRKNIPRMKEAFETANSIIFLIFWIKYTGRRTLMLHAAVLSYSFYTSFQAAPPIAQTCAAKASNMLIIALKRLFVKPFEGNCVRLHTAPKGSDRSAIGRSV